MRTTTPEKKNYGLLFYFIGAWILVNLLQAWGTGLDGDEAYYWMFSRQLQWGYFDHPPMVAFSIKLGEMVGHGSFFTRLGTVLFSAGAIFFAYKALPENIRNVKFYVLTFASVVLLNMYGFIVTPDSSLFFFTSLFFYAYRLYLDKEKPLHIFLLAFSIAGLLYSKYHGVLPVVFTFLSNPKLFLKPSAWLVTLLVAAAFTPHLLWQYQHDWPTFRYHLLERVGSNYRIDKTTNYLAGQLLVWGPFTTIPALYFFLREKVKDVYLRAHYFTLWGVFFFFLLSSFRSTIETHWTLTAGVSFIVLFQKLLAGGSLTFRKIFVCLFILNIIFIAVARILFLIPDSPLNKAKAFNSIFYGKLMADSIHKYAEGTPVVFVNSYTQASLYKYYYRKELTTAYNTITARRNYFSLSTDESILNNKKVVIATGYEFGKPDVAIKGFADPMYLYHLDSFRAVNTLKLFWLNERKTGKPGEVIESSIELSASGNYSIQSSGKLYINYTFIKTRKEYEVSKTLAPLIEKEFTPGFKKQISIALQLPATAGNYRLIFSIVQPPFAGTFSSPFYDVEVE